MALFVKMILTFLTVFKWTSEAQHVVFELVDSEFNEVIFVGENDIVLNCSITCITNALIIVKPGDTVMVRNDTNDGYLEYKIDEVLSEDNSGYTCIVTYLDVNTSMAITEMKTLHLNVNEKRPQCIRNGTRGQPFLVGDLLLMSCYCFENDGCKWSTTVEGVTVFTQPVVETFTYRRKNIQRILEVHTMSANMSVRYHCFKSNGMAGVCSIGPSNRSSEDNIVNRIPSNDGVSGNKADCDLFQTSTDLSTIKSTRITVPTQKDAFPTEILEPEAIDIFLIGVIAGGMGIFILLILVIICIVLLLGKRNKTETKKHADPDSHMYNNVAFDGQDGTKDNLERGNYTSKSEMSSDYDLPPLDKVHQGKQINQDDYADINESRDGPMPNDSPTKSQTKYSNSERNGLSATETLPRISQNSYTITRRGDASTTHNNDGDFDHLYSQVNKKSSISRNKYSRDPDLEVDEVEEDFGNLYAKVDKDKKKKVEPNNGTGDLYAEIDEHK